MIDTETTVAIIPGYDTAAVEQKIEREVTDIEFQADAMTVECDEDYAEAGIFGRSLKSKTATVVEFFKPMKDNAFQAHKAVCDREKAMLAPLKNAEAIVKKKMGAYSLEKERQRKAAEEALRRAAELERERKLAEAAALEEAGKGEEAEDAVTEAIVMDEAARYSVQTTAQSKVQGVSTSKDWEIVDIDSKLVPNEISGIEIRPVDKAAVMRLIRASKGKISIPGIAYREIAKMSFRRG